MGKLSILLLALMILSACITNLSARSWYILPDGEGDAPTIQAGIDSAAAGDTVLLANGTYTGDGNSNIDFLGKAIVVISQSGNPDSCVIDCEGIGCHRGFNFHSGEDSFSVLEGLTITNGSVDVCGTYVWRGGAISCTNSSPTIRSCIFSYNNSGFEGGAIYGSPTEIIDCKFDNNNADEGGAIYGSPAKVIDCIFNNNFSPHQGGAILGSPAMIIRCTFISNGAGWGGAIYGSPTLISDCIFSSNYSGDGGGINGNPSTIINTTFSNNSGGGMRCKWGSPTIMNCNFIGNWNPSGAGILFDGGAPVLTGCNFVGNRGFPNGGGMYVTSLATPILNDCVFTSNGAHEGGALYISGASATLTNCTFSDNTGYSSGGALYIVSSQTRISDCDFSGNSSENGGAVHSSSSQSKFNNCNFSRNRSSLGGGGGLFLSISTDTLVNCAFIANYTSGTPWIGGGGVYCLNNSNSVFISCTFYGNIDNKIDGGPAASIHIDNSFAEIDKSIISYTQGGQAASCRNGGGAILSCSNVYGNAGGDWVGCIAEQEGINGNFSADPFFCDPDNDDLTLSTDSPCLAENNPGCGLIGAFGVGCGDGYTPIGSNVVVQPPDSVSGTAPVTVTFDSVSVAGVTKLVISSLGQPPPNGFKVCSNTYYDITTTAIYVGTIVVCIDYSASGCTGKVELKRFVDGVWVPCEPWYEPSPNVICGEVSSLSTFAVFTPIGITFDIKPRSCPNPFNMKWLENSDKGGGSDHALHRKGGVMPAALVGSEGFNVSEIDTSTLLLEGIAPLRTSLEDVTRPVIDGGECACTTGGPDGILDLSMKLSRLEVAGILGEVEHGDVVELTITGELNDGTPFEATDCITILSKHPEPKIYEGGNEVKLYPAIPNPFNPSTTISYYLPVASIVTVEIYDSSGRLISRLLDRANKPKGMHEVEWKGIDRHGNQVASGVYFYRLITGNETISKKMVLLR